MAAVCVRDFKACAGTLYMNKCTELNDYSEELLPLFQSIEKVIESGIKVLLSMFGETNQYFWNIFEKLMNSAEYYKYEIPYSLSSAYSDVSECPRVKTAIGRGRLLLRTLANKGSLGDLILLLKENRRFLHDHYDRSKAVLTNDIQCQIFYSFIADLTRIKFDLNLTHADFLDTTWEIPVYKIKDFVPCSKLGVKVRYVDSYYIITDFEECYDEEDKFFELGDAITSLAGIALRGKVLDLHKICAKERRKLLRFEIAKMKTTSGSYFPPIVNIIKKEGIPNILASDYIRSQEDDPLNWPAIESLDLSKCYAALDSKEVNAADLNAFPPPEVEHSLRYVGCVDMGDKSDKQHIPEAIEAVLAEHPVVGRYMPVRVRLGELEVSFSPVLPNSAQCEAFLKRAYPTISAVGQKKEATRYFGFIAGDTTCTIATKFTAYVFLALTRKEALRIVKGITNGFKRTSWTT
ncbi:hypothetical protein Aperf_G00000070233 [Anoplocephala perfoliata]